METFKKNCYLYKELCIISIMALVIGIIVGIVDTIFGKVLLEITNLRNNHVNLFLPFLSIGGLLITFLYQKFGKDSIKGMSLIFAVGCEEEKEIPKRLVPIVVVSTWITHLFGGSAGREGVAVQIGGAISHIIGKHIKVQNSSKIFLITGMAAGFAGLFQTPIAAIFFAMEVLIVGSLQYIALLPSIIAAFTASYTSHLLGLEKFTMPLNTLTKINPSIIFKIILLGIAFGIVGGLFAKTLDFSKKFFHKTFDNPYIRILVMGCALSILLLLLHHGRYSGLGTNLVQNVFSEGVVYNYDWLFKFLLTIITLSAGFQGGEVTPLFSIGASLGAVLATLLGLPVHFSAALGFLAVFGSGTNTLISPIFVGAEIFGYECLPYYFIISVIAFMFNGNKSIYTAQKLS